MQHQGGNKAARGKAAANSSRCSSTRRTFGIAAAVRLVAAVFTAKAAKPTSAAALGGHGFHVNSAVPVQL